MLAGSDRPLSTATLETYVELGRNRLEAMLKVLDVDGAVRRVQGGWEATGREWVYDAERYDRVREAREREQAAMLAYLDSDECRMRYLREQLDDPDAADCGRCDNCGGLSLATAVSDEAVAVGQRPAVPARRGGRAAQDVADRAGQPRAGPQGQDRHRCRPRAARSPGSPTSATGRPCASSSPPGSRTDPSRPRWPRA